MPEQPSLSGGFGAPFQEQVDFFRAKLTLGTRTWRDIQHEAHDRAFVVAGAMKADLLDDLRRAVEKGIAQGTTLETFRKDFRQIVLNRGWHGWTGEGSDAGFNWRTKVIYETNLRSSYAAGRWAQLNDPGLKKLMPYWRYVHSDSVLSPRPLHLRWGSERLTLPSDHAFWRTHFPPNGWGCRCRVVAVAEPKPGDATKPPDGWDQRGEDGRLPGIDEGWGYAPGASNTDDLRELVRQKAKKLAEPIGKALAEDVEKNLSRSMIDYLGKGKLDELAKEMADHGRGDKNLTEAQNVSVYAYTKSWYLQVNRKIRDGSVGNGAADPTPLINMVDRALKKLPAYKGAVTRGVHYPYEVFDDLAAAKPGEVIGFRSYSSAAHSGAKDFGGNTRFIIDTETARKIDHIAYEPRESEALIPRETQFEILRVETSDNGRRMTVFLRELPAGEYRDGLKWY
jgi:hypothetical protein